MRYASISGLINVSYTAVSRDTTLRLSPPPLLYESPLIGTPYHYRFALRASSCMHLLLPQVRIPLPSAPLLYSPPKGLTHYELKNWSGWQSWFSKAFRDQFLKDLAAMAEGRRVKWVFSGHKMSREEVKQKVIRALQDAKWEAQLTSMIRKLPERSPLKIILGSKVNSAESLIKAIDEHDTIFDFLFEITKQ